MEREWMGHEEYEALKVEIRERHFPKAKEIWGHDTSELLWRAYEGGEYIIFYSPDRRYRNKAVVVNEDREENKVDVSGYRWSDDGDFIEVAIIEHLRTNNLKWFER